MRVIFCGQSGLDKLKILDSLKTRMNRSIENNHKGDESKLIGIYSVENNLANTPIKFRSWLEAPDEEDQLDDWRAGFNKLRQKINVEKPTNIFLSMHCAIYKYNKYVSPVDWEMLREFNPDLIITFIDDIIDIWWRLKFGPGRVASSEDYRLHELMTWRSVEFTLADTLSRNLFSDKKIPHYVMSVKQPSRTLEKLLIHPEQLRVYSAYPITDAKAAVNDKNIDVGIIKEIDAYRAKLHENYITFDPITIDEYELKILLERNMGENTSGRPIAFVREHDRWPVQSEICNFPLLSDALEYPEVVEDIDPIQITEIVQAMSYQIKSRDFKLLDQVHCMAAYRPNFNGGSFGVQSEMGYSAMKRKPFYQYWPIFDGEQTRPFKDGGIITDDLVEFYSFLSQHQEQIRNDPNELAHLGTFEGYKSSS